MTTPPAERNEIAAIREHLYHVNPREVYDLLFERQLVRAFGDDYFPQLDEALDNLRDFCGRDTKCLCLVSAVESAAMNYGDDAHADGIRFAVMFTREFRAMSKEVLGIETTI